jgi:hypothetical protein
VWSRRLPPKEWFDLNMTDNAALLSWLVPTVVGIVAIIVSVYLYKKANPRRELTYTLSVTPLVQGTVRGLDKLTVTYDGWNVDRPYVVTLDVGSTGRADISSSHFDDRKPIVFDLGTPILGELEQTISVDTVDTTITQVGDSLVHIGPCLLPKGIRIKIAYLCNGKPNLRVSVPLPDTTLRTDFRARFDFSSQADQGLALQVFGLFILLLATLYFIWS